ncbi:hypothetical protein ACFL54_09490, partial [Planctomycetota bacterium]
EQENSADPRWPGLPARREWDAITVDIETTDVQGNSDWLFADSGLAEFTKANQGETGYSNAHGTRLVDFSGRNLRIQQNENIRLRFFFNEKQDTEQPLHDTPVLDDITITFIPGKPTVLLWQVIQ